MRGSLWASVAGLLLTLTTVPITAHPQTREGQVQPSATAATGYSAQPTRALVDRYCLTCHSDKVRTAGLTLETLDAEHVGQHAEIWEKVLRKLRAGAMPPAGRPRPTPEEATPVVAWLETSLDRAAQEHPDPGRPPSHRLNRFEYGNAIRDLLDLEVDVRSLLPPDDSGLGFDSIAELLSVSPTLLERYLAAARKISRLAVGDPTMRSETYSVSRDLTQDDRISDDLPLGSRGGIAVRHYFPVDGEYLLKVRMFRNLLQEIRGMAESHQVDVRLDGTRVKVFTIGAERPEQERLESAAVHLALGAYQLGADDGLEVRLPIKAGPHLVGVTLLNQSAEVEGPIQRALKPRTTDSFKGRATGSGIGQLEIRGPEKVTGPGETPSRRRIFICQPSATSGAKRETACARQILSTLARRAYRRPVTDADMQDLLSFFEAGRSTGTFEAGIERALRRMLVSSHFLFRIERDPADIAPNTPYRLTDLALASRLSFFLWSSIPDDQLLNLAVRGKLSERTVLEQQVRRMLADPRSKALVTNFAGQWLYLRNVPFVTPNENGFPEFDDNLRQAFRKESDLFVESILREDRSVVDLLTANYTFVNERLARHYGIPNVYGSYFRRVTLSDDQSARAGILGHGSVLTVTSYATRTSPVLRGKWILENVLGAPPPPPPPNVPALKEKTEAGKPLSMRQAMEQHRKNPVCASCHARMDPLGFALENFDAVGRWRTTGESQEPIDASGALVDGTTFQGPTGLRQVLLSRRQDFVNTLAEKLLIYATGRAVEFSDFPSLRAVVREAAASDYKFSSLILGVVRSMPFQMRRSGERPTETTVASNR